MNKEEIQQNIIERMKSGDYNHNLEYAMRLASLAVESGDKEEENYLLLQSVAQSQIAQTLLLEEIVGLLFSKEGEE